VAYVDNDAFACAVVRSNIAKAFLPAAPVIQADIRSLRFHHLRGKVDIVLAGFPCQDISTLNNVERSGLQGRRSGLFFEVVRIAQETHAPLIFLENVSCILTRGQGLDMLLQSLQSHGYRLVVHTLVSARDVGAPHIRKRWFCLALRMHLPAVNCCTLLLRPVEHMLSRSFASEHCDERKTWSKNEPVDRLVPRTMPRNTYDSIWHALGNSVVPLCARTAFAICIRTVLLLDEEQGTTVRATKTARHRIEDGKASVNESVFVESDRGGTRTVSKASVWPQQSECAAKDLDLRIVDGSNAIILRAKAWSTPTASWINPMIRAFTQRGSQKPASMIFYDRGTLDKFLLPGMRIVDMSRKYDVNPQFLEWLMGYPRGWTAV
jgi:site-specific DNA-cytosine methylase